MIRILEFDELDSTNNYLASKASDMPHGTVVRAECQSAGRGQRGNSWESAPGENILMSVLLKPSGLKPSEQFRLSQAVALAIVKTLRPLLPDKEVCVKWPNDIYVGDEKICGVLIENIVSGGRIESSIAGIGINVNQQEFHSDAPNPTSLAILTGCRYDVADLSRRVAFEVVEMVDELCENSDVKTLSEDYNAALWRREGYHPYYDCVRGEEIEGRIAEVAPDGTLTLDVRTLEEDSTQEIRSYTFKQLSAILR